MSKELALRQRLQVSKLLRSAKISDYRFVRVMEQYVRDATSTEAARATGLSVNSVHDLFRKLRVFFYEVGTFQDYYQGQDPMAFEYADPEFERDLLSFHLARCGKRRGLKSPISEPPYHFAESCWRYDFVMMMRERPSDAVYAMMQRQLLELIRLCGPVGRPPSNRLEGIRTVMRHIDERIDWFRRNAPSLRDELARTELASTRAITEDSGPDDVPGS